MVADFSRGNAEKLAAGADVIVDGLDSFETRFLINDVALKLKIPGSTAAPSAPRA